MSSDKVINIHTKRKHTQEDPQELLAAYRAYEAARLQVSLELQKVLELEKKFLTPRERATRRMMRSSKYLNW